MLVNNKVFKPKQFIKYDVMNIDNFILPSFTFILGIIGNTLLERIKRRTEKKRVRDSFIMDVEKLKKRVNNDINRLYKEYNLYQNQNEEIDLVYGLIVNIPQKIGQPYDLNFYHGNYKYLIYLEKETREKIISIFERASTINHLINDYNEAQIENIDKPNRNYKNTLVLIYFGHLKHLKKDIDSFKQLI
jgi:hypothetical protein